MFGVIPAFLVTLVLWGLIFAVALLSGRESNAAMGLLVVCLFGAAILSSCWLGLELLLFLIRVITATIRDEWDREP